jgi:hypothetical protein
MATATQRDAWLRSPSPDPWSEPSASERRFFERRDSDPVRHSWTSDPDLRPGERRDSTPASTRRSTVARVIGVVGVLGVLGLAAFAFAPRVPAAASQLALVANRVQLPWDPALQPGPAPVPLDRDGPLAARTGPVAPAALAPAALEPAAGSRVDNPATAAPLAAPATEAEREPPSAAESTDRGSDATMSTMKEPAGVAPRGAASVSESRAAEVPAEAREPMLTREEIERRKQRYEEWLKSEGLERVR